ncbi:MAG: RNA-binding S4 domain-containing protein [Bacteroidota bacterium]
MAEIRLRTEEISLAQLLKWTRVVESGGQARNLIGQGMVEVNGIKEYRAGRRLVPGDWVRVKGGERMNLFLDRGEA